MAEITDSLSSSELPPKQVYNMAASEKIQAKRERNERNQKIIISLMVIATLSLMVGGGYFGLAHQLPTPLLHEVARGLGIAGGITLIISGIAFKHLRKQREMIELTPIPLDPPEPYLYDIFVEWEAKENALAGPKPFLETLTEQYPVLDIEAILGLEDHAEGFDAGLVAGKEALNASKASLEDGQTALLGLAQQLRQAGSPTDFVLGLTQGAFDSYEELMEALLESQADPEFAKMIMMKSLQQLRAKNPASDVESLQTRYPELPVAAILGHLDSGDTSMWGIIASHELNTLSHDQQVAICQFAQDLHDLGMGSQGFMLSLLKGSFGSSESMMDFVEELADQKLISSSFEGLISYQEGYATGQEFIQNAPETPESRKSIFKLAEQFYSEDGSMDYSRGLIEGGCGSALDDEEFVPSLFDQGVISADFAKAFFAAQMPPERIEATQPEPQVK